MFQTPIVDAVAKVDNFLDSESPELVTDWNPPQTPELETETVVELFSRGGNRTKVGQNKNILDFLHNNHERLAVQSYFEIPTDPSVVIDEWALPDGIRGNVYLDSEELLILVEFLLAHHRRIL